MGSINVDNKIRALGGQAYICAEQIFDKLYDVRVINVFDYQTFSKVLTHLLEDDHLQILEWYNAGTEVYIVGLVSQTEVINHDKDKCWVMEKYLILSPPDRSSKSGGAYHG